LCRIIQVKYPPMTSSGTSRSINKIIQCMCSVKIKLESDREFRGSCIPRTMIKIISTKSIPTFFYFLSRLMLTGSSTGRFEHNISSRFNIIGIGFQRFLLNNTFSRYAFIFLIIKMNRSRTHLSVHRIIINMESMFFTTQGTCIRNSRLVQPITDFWYIDLIIYIRCNFKSHISTVGR